MRKPNAKGIAWPLAKLKPKNEAKSMNASPLSKPDALRVLYVFLCGDVMTGRGVDQILPHPCAPHLHEDYVRPAKGYVRLVEQAHGPIPARAPAAYISGAALDELSRTPPDARIVNLKTSITRSDEYIPKGINYRMSRASSADIGWMGRMLDRESRRFNVRVALKPDGRLSLSWPDEANF
jgi:hypothetical protein